MPKTIDSAAAPTPAGGLRSAVNAFVGHRALFAATAGLVLFATFIVTLCITPAYRSELTLQIRNPAPGALDSLREILRSREVAESIVAPEWSKTPLSQHSGAEIRRHERDVADFARRLDIAPAAGDGTLRVAYIAETPNQAADVLGQLIEESAARLKLHEPAASRRQSVQPPAAAAAIQGDPASTELLRSRIAALDAARRTAETQLAETADRVAAQKHDLAILSPWILGDVNPIYKQGKEKLGAGIAQLGSLRSRIAGLTAQREQLAQQLAGTEAASTAPLPATAPPVSATSAPSVEELIVTERPTLPMQPIRPRPMLYFVAGLIAACFFGLCAVVIAELRSRTSTRPKPEVLAHIPLLAMIPNAAPRSQRTFGALALSPVFREEPEPSTGLFSVTTAQLPLAAPAPAARLVLEPLEPAPRLPARGLGNTPLPARSRLTPSQRAQLRSSAPPPDPAGRGYVTYTFDARQ